MRCPSLPRTTRRRSAGTSPHASCCRPDELDSRAVLAAGASQLAELAVVLGANVQQDQLVTVGASLGEEEMAQEVAAAAYRHGARFVDVTYFDPYVKRARIEHAREETLGFVPSWYGDRMLELGRQRAARISFSGPAPPDVLDGVDPERAGRDQLPFIKEVLTVINERLVNWTVVPAPTARWARLVYPELAEADALERLWAEIGHVCRLDEPDPVAAWAARGEELEDRRAAAGRCPVRCAPLRGAGHRSRRRPLPGGGMGDRVRRDGRRHRAPGEPAQRGSLHNAGSGADRGSCPVDTATRAGRRSHSAGANCAVRGRRSG